MDKGLRRLTDVVTASRLCYGEPVREGERTVIPVARVRVAGGWGFGHKTLAKSKNHEDGSGGGGVLEARPAGFIEIGPAGALFHEIPDPERRARMLKAGAKALTTVLTGAAGIAGARRLADGPRRRPLGRGRRSRRPAGLLGR